MKKTLRVAGTIIRHDGKFLMLHRPATDTDPSLWGIPAGKVEARESDEATAIREVFEETGIKLSAAEVEYLGQISVDFGTFIVDFPIFTTILEEIPEITLSPREHIDYRWFTAKEALALPNLMKDVDKIIGKFCS